MIKKIYILAVLAALLSCQSVSGAQTQAPLAAVESGPAKSTSEERMIRTLEAKLRANRAFLKAAREAVEKDKDPDADSYLKKAESLSEEGARHHGDRDYAFAIEDISESSRMALYAIVLSRGVDAGLRDTLIHEELSAEGLREHEKKEEMILKGTAEVEAFIKAGEKLLAEDDNPSARKKLGEAKRLTESSKRHVAKNDYDTALEEVRGAYGLATGVVKEIKRAKGEIIAFPRPSLGDDRSVLEYEAKRNSTYFFYAEKVVDAGDRDGNDSISRARSLREEASTARDNGDIRTAIERLRSSTATLMKALKGVLND